MATSNRDRVRKMFELLAPPLDAFIGEAVAQVLTNGASWTSLVELKDQQKGISGKTYSATDPQVQLRMLTENIPHQLRSGWYPFDDAIGQVLGPSAATHRAMVAAVTPIAIPPAHASALDANVLRRLQRGAFPVYQLDGTAYPGHSGSPVWVRRHPSKGGRVLVAVHISRDDPTFPDKANRAVFIDKDVRKFIVSNTK